MKETSALATKESSQHSHGAPGYKGPNPVDEDALRRLRNIEGQVRGLRKMVEEGKYCVDILTQVSAVRAALNQVGMMVLKRHVEHCVVGAVKSADAAAGAQLIEELMTVIGKGGL